MFTSPSLRARLSGSRHVPHPAHQPVGVRRLDAALACQDAPAPRNRSSGNNGVLRPDPTAPPPPLTTSSSVDIAPSPGGPVLRLPARMLPRSFGPVNHRRVCPALNARPCGSPKRSQATALRQAAARLGDHHPFAERGPSARASAYGRSSIRREAPACRSAAARRRCGLDPRHGLFGSNSSRRIVAILPDHRRGFRGRTEPRLLHQPE